MTYSRRIVAVALLQALAPPQVAAMPSYFLQAQTLLHGSQASLHEAVGERHSRVSGHMTHLQEPTIEDEEALLNPGEFALVSLWELAVSVLLMFTLSTLAAFFYKGAVMTDEEVDRSKHSDDWSSGLFHCFSDVPICFWSCCCPCIRWADTLHHMGFMSFWSAYALFLGLLILYWGLSVVGIGIFIWLAFCVALVKFRHQMREQFKMTDRQGFSYFEDLAIYCCCWPCAIAQEARHVKAVLKRA